MNRLDVEDTPLAGLKRVRRRAARRFARLPGAAVLRRRAARRRLELAPVAQINHTRTASAAASAACTSSTRRTAEKKLVHCLRGEVCDVAVDLRRGSPTFLRWHARAAERRDNGVALLIPEGFAHGLQTLADDVEHALLPLGRLRCRARGRRPSARAAPGDRLAAADRARCRRATTAHRLRSAAELRRDRGMKCRHCARRARPQSASTWAARRRSNAYLTRRALRAPELWYPAAPARVRALLAGADRGPRRRARPCSATTTPTSARSRRSWLAHAEAYVAGDARRASTLSAGEPASARSPPTTATCCSYVQRAPASRASASSRRRAPRARRARSGLDIVERLLRRRARAQSSARDGPPGRSRRGQQRAGPRSRHQRLRRRLRGAAQARRRRDLRVPAPAAAGRARTSSTPSTTSTTRTCR